MQEWTWIPTQTCRHVSLVIPALQVFIVSRKSNRVNLIAYSDQAACVLIGHNIKTTCLILCRSASWRQSNTVPSEHGRGTSGDVLASGYLQSSLSSPFRLQRLHHLVYVCLFAQMFLLCFPFLVKEIFCFIFQSYLMFLKPVGSFACHFKFLPFLLLCFCSTDGS